MIKKDQIPTLAKFLKIKDTDLEAALTSTEEVELTIPELTVLTPDELKTRDDNQKKNGYNEGKTASLEMLVKDTKEKLGLEFEGKDPEKLFAAIQKKALDDAKIEPNAKVKELQAAVEKQQATILAFESEKQAMQSQIEAVKTDSQLLGLFPANRLGVLNDEEYLTIFKRDYTIAVEDGKQVVKKGGEILRDKTTQAPIAPKDAVTSVFTERNWLDSAAAGQQGRGGKNDPPPAGIHLKLSSLTKEWEDQKKSTNGLDFGAAVKAAQEANPSFDLNS